jgi:transposase
MQHYSHIKCIHCKGSNLVKNGHSENKTQRWFCNECERSFQLDYSYNARKPGVKEQIAELTLNSSGVRDIGRILKISKNTVVTELKKNTQNQSLFIRHSRVKTT